MIRFQHNPCESLRITSPFGVRTHPISKEKQFHYGIDIGKLKSAGEPLYAVAAGTVIVAKANKGDPSTGYGWYVVIDFGGWGALYAHQQGLLVKTGQKVKAGELVGRMGTSGSSTAVHLHFGLYKGDFSKQQFIDPQPYLLTGNEDEREEEKVIYKTAKDIPAWGKATIEKLIQKGYLLGDQNGELNISEDMLRVLVINDRANLYNGSII